MAGETAITVITGKARLIAQVFMAALAIRTMTAGVTQPGHADPLAEQVVRRNIERRLGRVVMPQGAVERRRDAFEVVDVEADDFRRQYVADCGDDRILTVAGNHCRRRCVAVTDRAAVGNELTTMSSAE